MPNHEHHTGTGGSSLAGVQSARQWPELSYLDLGEIQDADGNTLFSMPTATPDDDLGERICLAFNAHAALLEMAKLLERTAKFEIRNRQRDGDDEGARMMTITLNMVRAGIAKAEGR